MLRMHFTKDDLIRIRVARGPDPLWEAVLSANLLGNTRGRAVFDGWRAQIRTRLRRLPHRQTRLVRYVAPGQGSFPDFITPLEAAYGLGAGVEAILRTPRSRVRQEMRVLSTLPSWLRPLADGESRAVRELGDALAAYFHTAVEPYWARVQAQVEADRVLRGRAMLTEGSEGLLESLRPVLRWRPPVLSSEYPVDRDLRLRGRGLLLVPSVFCWRTPVTLVDPELPPVLVYPAARGPQWWDPVGERREQRTLAHLLGSGRASALRMVEDGCTTSELARRTGLAVPTASEHATTLREAGLIVSVRRRNTVVHTLTPLGADLLTANSGGNGGC